MVDPISTPLAAIAIGFAALTWWEARKQRHLLETLTKSLPYISRRRTRTSSAKRPTVAPRQSLSPIKSEAPTSEIPAAYPNVRSPSQSELLKQKAEERRRLKLELEREKEQWKRQKDIAKAISWVLDRIGSDDEEDEG